MAVKIGCYVTKTCCSKCDWFPVPNTLCKRSICPRCGEALEPTVGRYKFRTTSNWFRPNNTEFLAFLRKANEV